jgi:type II secretory ATPase GspE/PulE/Tfp pilus assembly ATPase PilB-like protein
MDRDTYTLYAGKGCASCHFTGMRGRTALFEVLPVTESIRTLINENAPTHTIREVARQEGMKTLREVGLMKVLEGLTTVAEVFRVTSE